MTELRADAAAIALACLGAAFVALSSSGASADEPRSEQALAEGLFQQGRQLMARGDVAEACAKFAESQRIEPKLGTLLNLAMCHERQGLTATAWAEFTRAAGQAKLLGQPAREELALRHARALEAALPKLVVDIEEPAENEVVTLDGLALGPGTLGIELPVDPGRHTIVATAPGRQDFRTQVEVAPGPGAQRLLVPKLEATQPAPQPPPKASPIRVTPPHRREAPRRTASAVRADETAGKSGANETSLRVEQRQGAWIAGGVAVAAAALGTSFGLRAMSLKSDADEHCDGEACSATGLERYDQVEDAAAISTVAFGVALVAGGLGVYFALRKDDSEPPRSAAVSRRQTGAFVSVLRSW